MKRCLLIVNPRSGLMEIKSELFNVIQILNEHNYEVIVQMTLYHQHAVEIAKNAHDVDLVICSGGDGTLGQVISGLIQTNKDVPIGYIPSGSTNDYANTLNLPMNIKDATLSIVNGSEYIFDVGQFNGDYHFVYIASFGLFTAVSYNTSQSAKNTFGPLAYFFNGLGDLVNAKAHHAVVRTNGEAVEGNYILGMISNTLSIGGIMKLNPTEVDLSDGMFEVLLIKEPKDLNSYNELINGLLTKNFSNKHIFYYTKASDVEIEFDKPLTWSLDGEEVKADKIVRISNINQRIRIVK